MPALLKSVAEHGSIEPILYEWATTVGAHSGGILQWRVPGSPAVALVADPDAVKAIFERGQWAKSPLYRDLEPLLGPQSLVLTERDEWREQRDAYNPAFTGAFLRSAFDGFCAATRELVAALDESAAFNTASSSAAAAAGAADAGADPSSSSPSSPVVGGGVGGTNNDKGGGDPGVARVWELVVLATVEIIFRVGFGESRGLLARADRDPLADDLYRAFYDLGLHVSWFLDNVPLNRLKSLPWNVAKTARLRAELERQLGRVLDGRLEAMRRSGSLPAGVEVVDHSSSSPSLVGTGGGGGGGAAGAPSACPFAGLAGGPGVEEGAEGEQPQQQQQSQQQQQQQQQSQQQDDGATLRDDDQMSLDAAAASAASASAPVSASASASAPPPSAAGPPAAAPPAAARDILSMAVATFAAKGAKTIDRSALLSQQATLFAAGHDTTAGLIAWTVYFLGRDGARRARLVAELDALFAARGGGGGDSGGGDNGGGGVASGGAPASSAAPPCPAAADVDMPTWEEISALPYLTAVIKETLRFRPPVGILARVCPVPAPAVGAAAEQGDQDPSLLPSGPDDPLRGAVSGYDLRGKIAVVSPYVLHRLERYWGKDANQWVPERWLDDEGRAPGPGATVPARALSVPQYAYVPFSRGPRDCIGSRFATIEAKVILAALFRRFDFEWAGPPGGERVRMALTAHPEAGVPMRVTWRRPPAAPGAGEEGAEEPGAGAGEPGAGARAATEGAGRERAAAR